MPIGELFCFISSLYFRGKLGYARRFSDPASIFVITAGQLKAAESGKELSYSRLADPSTGFEID